MSVVLDPPVEGGAEVAPEESPKARGRTGYLLLAPGTVWLLLFFIVPLVTLVSTSLYDPAGTLEKGYQLTFAFGNYVEAIKDYAPEFLRSLLYAGLATVFALLLGYPLAYAIAFKAGRWKSFMLVLVIAPFFTSFLIRTLSWKMLLSDQGFIVSSLNFLQIPLPDDRLLATAPAVVLGLTYNFLPFMVLPLFASLDKIDGRLIEAAGDLYAGPFEAFRRVTLPLSMPGVIAGTLLTFIPAAGDYINVELLGTPQQTMIGNRIQSLFGAGSYPAAAALSVTLMLLIVAMVTVYIRRAGTEELL
uniref:Putrescine transport system permease protein PotH n=1 Tax=uncultured Nocardioidaceae bacterium TaxID=253824 RepID=A0A6J4MK36_9ACTN|nr:MAG: Putrescine transport system permease protein PotH [uncultured Nocardioidaceae bacterium]